MAAYFPTFRRQSSRSVAPVEQPDVASHSPAEENADGRWEPSASILIFPSPPSSIPPTPPPSSGLLPHSIGSASMSNFSLPTSISVDSSLESSSEKSTPSSYHRIRLRRQEQPVQRGRTSASGDRNTDRPAQHSLPHKLEVDLESVSENTGDGHLEVEVWEWSQRSSHEASSSPQGEESSPRNRFFRSLHTVHYPGGEAVEISWPPHLRQRTISQFTQISDTSNVSQMSYVSQSTTPSSSQSSPPTPLYFPFISLIKQLLGIDPDTIMLLGALGRSSGAEAALFLGNPFEQAGSTRQTVSNIKQVPDTLYSELSQTDSARNPMVALLSRYSVESTPRTSTSTQSIKAGLRAAAEYQTSNEDSPGAWGVLLSFPPGPSMSIQDLLLSPVKLTSSIASGAVSATTRVIGHSSNVVGSALNVLSRPVVSVADVVGWRRNETVATST